LKLGSASRAPAGPRPPAGSRSTSRGLSDPRRPRRDYGHRRAVGLVVLAVLLAVVVSVAWFLISLFQPFTGAGSGTVVVTIPEQASSADIGSLLVKDKVVSSSFFFRLRVQLGGDHLHAGTYTLKRGMSYSAALAVLNKAPAAARTTNVTIIPGKSRYQLSQLLSSQGVKGSYLVESRRSRLLDPVHYGAPHSTPTLEGFLYPDTYNLREPVSVAALIADQLEQFKKEFHSVNFSYAKSRHLTPYDVLIIASLEDAEAALPGDLPKVAGVIYNRLAAGMNLGLDTTAAYATNNYTGNLSNRQLNSSSAWNTLNHRGLPPTPIDSPDLAAINAAAHPAPTNALYFIVKVCGNGALDFTSSYAQFERWSVAYSTSLAKRGAQKTEFCSKHS
jgi:UPF0755 protein